ncbi:MAG: N-acetyltransferase [Syntrophales bacterium]|nr:N-acetyltransferase [Syntrophales bacterium]MDD5233330.1 N-acetyltransferase [Syntrophales bacterium]MDD5532570.1 N-acetyltransferase [Syntrophales bacterium]HPL63302.1 N-acetyltransferase [Syntrophales bacterium]
MMEVRFERSEDIPSVREINQLAFARRTEADIVDNLRKSCPDAVSLVVEEDGRIVGHIMFTPVIIEGVDKRLEGMGLGPVAVRPDLQRKGIGSALIRCGLEILRGRRCPFVVVLGIPGFYSRFGFEQASRHGIKSPWEEVPEDAFMINIFNNEDFRGLAGIALFRKEFDEG